MATSPPPVVPGRSLDIATKSSATDLVTALDRTAEATIVARLAGLRPGDAVVGEEGTHQDGTSGVSWLIDPIDGTTNFVYGVPQWATSVAASAGGADARRRGVRAGDGRAVRRRPRTRRDPQRRADLGPAPAPTCRSPSSPPGSATGPKTVAARLQLVADVIGSVRDIRRIGSAAIDLCYVACGRVDAYYEAGLNPWDVAAGELIAREAGCRSGDFDGGPPVANRLLGRRAGDLRRPRPPALGVRG